VDRMLLNVCQLDDRSRRKGGKATSHESLRGIELEFQESIKSRVLPNVMPIYMHVNLFSTAKHAFQFASPEHRCGWLSL
jgi:hypothetical protein